MLSKNTPDPSARLRMDSRFGITFGPDRCLTRHNSSVSRGTAGTQRFNLRIRVNHHQRLPGGPCDCPNHPGLPSLLDVVDREQLTPAGPWEQQQFALRRCFLNRKSATDGV